MPLFQKSERRNVFLDEFATELKLKVGSIFGSIFEVDVVGGGGRGQDEGGE